MLQVARRLNYVPNLNASALASREKKNTTTTRHRAALIVYNDRGWTAESTAVKVLIRSGLDHAFDVEYLAIHGMTEKQIRQLSRELYHRGFSALVFGAFFPQDAPGFSV